MTGGTAIVVCPSGRSNVMGRALALAELLQRAVGHVSVFAPDDGPLWPPARRWEVEIRRGGDPARAYADLDPEKVRWIWLVKPLSEGYRAVGRLLEAFPAASLIADFDDDDEGLSREFLAETPLNWLRLARSRSRRQLMPAAIARTRGRVLGEAAAFTAATETVAERCGLPPDRALRIIHPRAVAAEPRVRTSDPECLHLGFFGTVRPHKGSRAIAALIGSDPGLRLHLYSGYDPTGFESVLPQIVEHPVDEPQARQFAQVDAVLLPQQRSPAGEVQLPAKLLDAMRFGVPVLATPTAAIREVAGDTIGYLDSWDDPVIARQAVEQLAAAGPAATEARARFESELSLEAMLPAVAQMLESAR